jgi:hypothetical protein
MPTLKVPPGAVTTLTTTGPMVVEAMMELGEAEEAEVMLVVREAEDAQLEADSQLSTSQSTVTPTGFCSKCNTMVPMTTSRMQQWRALANC